MKLLRHVVILSIGLAGASSKHLLSIDQPSYAPPTSEQAQVYGDFLEQFSKVRFGFLADRTFYFERARIKKNAPCLKGLRFSLEDPPAPTLHSLDSSVLRGRSIPVVNEQEELAILSKRDANRTSDDGGLTGNSGTANDLGIMALSEITFDKSHNYALLRYVILCGSHCNSGSTLVLERVDSKWRVVRPACNVSINEASPRP